MRDEFKILRNAQDLLADINEVLNTVRMDSHKKRLLAKEMSHVAPIYH